MDKYKDSLKKLVSENNLVKALDQLQADLSPFSKYFNEVINIKRRLCSNLKRDFNLNESTNIAINNNTSQILTIIDNLKEIDLQNITTHLESIRLEIDPYISQVLLRSELPKKWNQRSLYLGVEGARKWITLKQEDYLPIKELEKIRSQLLNTLSYIENVDLFISLGPGDGEVDKEIAINLKKVKTINYVPIDISSGLLLNAFGELHDEVHIPFGILTCFEKRFNFIENRLKGFIGRPLLIGLLGNTLGNLDRYEKSLLQHLEHFLRKGDYLLFDISIIKDNWEFQHDPAVNHKMHTLSMREFYARGLFKQKKISIVDFLDNYEKRLIFREGSSDVPEAKAIEFFDSKTNTKILSIRRYQWTDFLRWFKSNFIKLKILNIEDNKNHFYFKDQDWGVGTILVQKV